jgi:hypothetical protein
MSVLVIPVDASQVAQGDRKQQKVRIAYRQGKAVKSQVIAVESGKAEIKLDVDPKQTTAIAVGPESASQDDLFNMQTLTVNVTPTQWAGNKTLTLSPVLITPRWWGLWLIWCREFTVTGRVVCADGSPVPGAQVQAYDVDFFWWWSSVLPVGPVAITDASGDFTIKFRWCCGWWPWWWWQLRRWVLDPILVERIYPILKLNPALRFPEPSPVVSLDFSGIQPQPGPRPPLPSGLGVSKTIDPTVIPALRDKLVAVLPHVPEFERLRLWPWWPWTPWLDCSPDLIFRVTQNCGGNQSKVIVNETIFQTRWNVPTNLNVQLIANSDACCLPHGDPPPDGDCALVTGVCGDPGIPVTSIGTSGPTAGYADPGGRDRPFAETVTISGQFGSSAQADYYEIEYSKHGAGTWGPLPAAAVLPFSRGYFDATQPWPNQWFYVGFPVTNIGARNLYMSRHYYEVTHPPANWGSALTGRTWFYNVNLLAYIQTNGTLPDDTYDFRVVGYKATGTGDPDMSTYKVMDGCGNNANNNMIVLRVDNRIVLTPTPGTVHINTTEPDCGINAVRIGGVPVAACGSQQLQPNTPFEIDFFATDPDGHLDHYELVLKYDVGSIKNLLSAADVGAFTLTPLSGGPEGPDYSNAITEGAVRPTWKGGTLRLHIDNASLVFPKTCCYLIELTVWKRNIVNCDGHLTYYNQTHYSFTVLV